MFEEKIRNVTNSTSINDNVYNGSRKITENDKNFMTPTNVKSAILNLKLKNSEGYDRIPQRILIDGISILLEPFGIIQSDLHYKYHSRTMGHVQNNTYTQERQQDQHQKLQTHRKPLFNVKNI